MWRDTAIQKHRERTYFFSNHQPCHQRDPNNIHQPRWSVGRPTVLEIESTVSELHLRLLRELISISPSFCVISLPFLKRALMAVLDNERATISSENNVFHILNRWLMQDFEERKPHLAKLIPLVRWSVMDINFFQDVVCKANWLKGCPQFQVPQQHRADDINTLLHFLWTIQSSILFLHVICWQEQSFRALQWMALSSSRKEHEHSSMKKKRKEKTEMRHLRSRPLPPNGSLPLEFTWDIDVNSLRATQKERSPSYLYQGYYLWVTSSLLLVVVWSERELTLWEESLFCLSFNECSYGKFKLEEDNGRKCSLHLYVCPYEEDCEEVGNCYIKIRQAVNIFSQQRKSWKKVSASVAQTKFSDGEGWSHLMSPYMWDDLFSGQCSLVVDGKLSLSIKIEILPDKTIVDWGMRICWGGGANLLIIWRTDQMWNFYQLIFLFF